MDARSKDTTVNCESSVNNCKRKMIISEMAWIDYERSYNEVPYSVSKE